MVFLTKARSKKLVKFQSGSFEALQKGKLLVSILVSTNFSDKVLVKILLRKMEPFCLFFHEKTSLQLFSHNSRQCDQMLELKFADFFKKMGHSRPLFLYFRRFFQLTVNIQYKFLLMT